MSGLKRREVIAAVASTALVPYPILALAAPPQIIDARIWPSPDYTRLTIEYDRPLVFRWSVIKNGRPRLQIDIEGLTLSDKLRALTSKISAKDPYVESASCTQYQPGQVRILLDLKTEIDPQVFLLEPFGGYKYRQVFDIYPAEAKDPLMAIIQKEESEPDAISRLLAQVAEGQRRMEQNRLEAESDQIGDLIAGITSGALKPSRQKQEAQPQKRKEKTAVAKSQKSKPARNIIIAIDPGHGGEDPGAIGRRYRTREKDVVLAIAKIMAREINRLKGYQAVLTRNGDYFVPLQRRVAKARAAQADIFVSVHADAWVKASASGSSVFTLNNRGSESSANRWLARSQNSSDKIGGINMRTQDKRIAKILMDMSFAAQVSDSRLYASHILSEMSRINRLHKKGVERANFAVLKAPDIPSVLIETAFISNPKEEAKLRTKAFQRKIACAIANGIFKGFGKKDRLRA